LMTKLNMKNIYLLGSSFIKLRGEKMELKIISENYKKTKVVDVKTNEEVENVKLVIWKGIPGKKSTAIIVLEKVPTELIPEVAIMTCTKCMKCGTECDDPKTKWGIEEIDEKEYDEKEKK
jgi:hypothetical protein